MSGRLELVRTIADWLGSGTAPNQEILVRMLAVPVDAGDSQPPPIQAYTDTTYPAPGNLAIFDETRHPWVADYTMNVPGAPALYLAAHMPIMMKGEATPDGQVRLIESPAKVAIGYISQNSNPAAAIRDGCYTLRAVARSVRELSKNAQANTRLRNFINIVLVRGAMEFWPVYGAIGNAKLAGALVLNYEVRDQNPSF